MPTLSSAERASWPSVAYRGCCADRPVLRRGVVAFESCGGRPDQADIVRVQVPVITLESGCDAALAVPMPGASACVPTVHCSNRHVSVSTDLAFSKPASRAPRVATAR